MPKGKIIAWGRCAGEGECCTKSTVAFGWCRLGSYEKNGLIGLSTDVSGVLACESSRVSGGAEWVCSLVGDFIEDILPLSTKVEIGIY